MTRANTFRNSFFAGVVLACLVVLGSACGGAAARGSTGPSPQSPGMVAASAQETQPGNLLATAEMPAVTDSGITTSPVPTPQVVPVASVDALSAGDTGDGTRDVTTTNRPKPLLIYEAHLALAVYEVERALDQVERIAKDAGGYLVSRNANAVVVRVPAGTFEVELKAILALGDVLQRDIKADDVTAKVRDLRVRLDNAEVVRKRLTELLALAVKTDDALAVERELYRVTEEIERMKGQLKLIRELVAFSTINVRFAAPQAENLDHRFTLPFPWLEQLGLSNLLHL